MGIGVAYQMTATLQDAGGAYLAGRVVGWVSSDRTKADVDANGIVTAVSAGTVSISATSEGRSAFATIVVSAGPVVPQWQVFASRPEWAAAVASYGLAPTTLTGVGPARVTVKNTDYGAFRIVVDSVSPTGNNPGYESGQLRLAIRDPFFPVAQATFNRLVFAQTVRSVSGDLSLVNTGLPNSTGGWITMTVGSTEVVVNDFVNSSGSGFFGVITATPIPYLTFTYRSKPITMAGQLSAANTGFRIGGALRAP